MLDNPLQARHECLMYGVPLHIIPPILKTREMRHKAVRESALHTPSAAFARGLGRGLDNLVALGGVVAAAGSLEDIRLLGYGMQAGLFQGEHACADLRLVSISVVSM